jgi:hypothetical protein
VRNSALATDVTNTLFTGDPEAFTNQLKTFAGRFGMTSEDLKNISVSALLTRMSAQADDDDTLDTLGRLSEVSCKLGLGSKQVSDLFGLGKKG